MTTWNDMWRDGEADDDTVRVWASAESDGNLFGDPVYTVGEEAGAGYHLIIDDEVVASEAPTLAPPSAE